MTIHPLACKILAKKGKKAEIEIEGQAVLISSEFVPAKARTGDSVSLRFTLQGEAELSEKQTAKMILDEILNGK